MGIAILVVMVLSIQTPVFALTQGPAQVIILTPSGTEVNTSNPFLPNMTGYTLSYVYRDTAFEQLSGDDAALVYSSIYRLGSCSNCSQRNWAIRTPLGRMPYRVPNLLWCSGDGEPT